MLWEGSWLQLRGPLQTARQSVTLQCCSYPADPGHGTPLRRGGLWPLSPSLCDAQGEGRGLCLCSLLQLRGISAFQGRKSAFSVFHFTARFFVREFQKCAAEPMYSLRQYVRVTYSKSMYHCLQGPAALEVYFIDSVYISVSLNRVKAYHH